MTHSLCLTHSFSVQAYVELSEYLFSFGAYKSAAYYFEMAFKVRRDYVYDSLNAKICIMVSRNAL